MPSFQAQLSEKVGLILSQLNCAICLEVYTNPVTLPCGNTFCKQCIYDFRDVIQKSKNQIESRNREEQQKFACPSCRVELGTRAEFPGNIPLKELADLARRTVNCWKLLFGESYKAPKVNVPLSQSTDASSDLSATLSSKPDIENEIPPHLSLFGEPLVTTKLDLKKGDNFRSPQPPVLSPVFPLHGIQPGAESPSMQQKPFYVSPPKVYGHSSSSKAAKPIEFVKPSEKDPYEFKGSQSQDEELRTPVNAKRKSAENKAGPSSKKSATTDQMMPPPRGKIKRTTKSGGSSTKNSVVNVLSSQNPEIVKMRSIIQAAEQVELVVEVESSAIPSERNSFPQKRIIEKEENLDEAQFNRCKKLKTDDESHKNEKTVDSKQSENVENCANHITTVEGLPENETKYGSNFGPCAVLFDNSPEGRASSHIEGQATKVEERRESETNELKKSSSTNLPFSSDPSAALGSVIITGKLPSSANISNVQIDNRRAMKTVFTETPQPSGYLIFFPDGKTAMAAIAKYLVDEAVQTEELSVAVVQMPATRSRRSVETQTEVVAVCASEIQIEDTTRQTTTYKHPPPGLPAQFTAYDETSSVFWSIPQDGRAAAITVDSQATTTMKSAHSSLQPSASSLAPDSLAQVAALCRSDEEAEDMVDTVIANSSNISDEVEFVASTPPVGEIVLPSQATASNQPPDSVDVVPSSVVSFLRSQDPGGVTNMQLTMMLEEDKTTPGRTVMNLSEITPATEIVKPKVNDDENRSLLQNFMNRISNQFNGANAQSSTPSGTTTTRRFTFAPEPAQLPPKLPTPQKPDLPIVTSVLPPSQADLPQLLRDARVETSTISLTSSGCTQYEPYFNALKMFCEMFSCRQTNGFIVQSTTHVVLKTLPGYDPFRVCDRTMKFLMAMASRRWVVSIQWVIDSVREKRVMPEEQYEITGDSSTAPDHCGPSKARSSRVGLLDNFEICCPEDSFANQIFTRQEVFQLIELCGGTKIESPDMFSYRRGTKRIIALVETVSDNGQTPIPPSVEELKRRKDMHRRYKAVILSVDWILDSISRCARIDASQRINAAYLLFPCSNAELVSLASN